MGRHPITLSAVQVAEVETLAAVLNAEQIADYFGIGRTTFFALLERDPEIAVRYKRGKARAIGAIAQTLISKARGGDTASMIFYLKTQAGWRETERHEHVAVPVAEMLDRVSDEDLERMLEILARRNEEETARSGIAAATSGPRIGRDLG